MVTDRTSAATDRGSSPHSGVMVKERGCNAHVVAIVGVDRHREGLVSCLILTLVIISINVGPSEPDHQCELNHVSQEEAEERVPGGRASERDVSCRCLRIIMLGLRVEYPSCQGG